MSAVSETVDGADLGARIKDAAAAAVLTVLLCVPIILLHAEADIDGVLHPIPRPWAVAIFALLAFFGRLAVSNAGAAVKKEAQASSPKIVVDRARREREIPADRSASRCCSCFRSSFSRCWAPAVR